MDLNGISLRCEYNNEEEDNSLNIQSEKTSLKDNVQKTWSFQECSENVMSEISPPPKKQKQKKNNIITLTIKET